MLVPIHRLARACLAGALLAACNPGPADPTSVFVSLSEYEIKPQVAEVDAGDATFIARNVGPDDPHELVIVRTDLEADRLPTVADGSFDEAGSGVEVIGEIEELAVEGQNSATFSLPAGRYVLLCNVVEEEEDGELEAHFAEGMHTSFTVW